MKHEKLTTANPWFLPQWDYELNGDLRPDNFTGCSDQLINWLCEKGHRWRTAIKNRTIGTGCPYCAGKKPWPGFNDLATNRPLLVEEWDYDKNEGFVPKDFTVASNKKVWWKCKLGHSWLAMIQNRSKGQRCPVCVGRRVLIGFNDLVTTHPKIAKEWDYEKNKLLRPEQFTIGSHKKVWWKCEHGHSWEARIYCRKKSGCRYCYGKNVLNPGVNDLLTVNPALATEWDYEKNNGLKPEDVAANTHTKAWWLCEKGHSWKAAVSNRNNGNGCPVCANKLLLKGYNDLLTVDPELCRSWDYEKNAPLTPDELIANSPQIVWWYCHIQRHSWQASVLSRRQGAGCPYCSGKAVLIGFNDLKTKRPDLADEWDYEKNGSLRPEHFTVQATPKVWWLCEKGHSYSSQIYNRYNGNGCPYCAGNLPIIGETDLATVHPELVREWDYVKNSPKRPEDYTSQSNMKVWWVCEEGHSWETFIYDRHNGTGCPYCARKLAIQGVTDAATVSPHLLDEWDTAKNENTSLYEILPNSGKKYWWKCHRGHNWLASVQDRTAGSGCPYCKGKKQMRTRLLT